jgi:hypothetical protein
MVIQEVWNCECVATMLPATSLTVPLSVPNVSMLYRNIGGELTGKKWCIQRYPVQSLLGHLRRLDSLSFVNI